MKVFKIVVLGAAFFLLFGFTFQLQKDSNDGLSLNKKTDKKQINEADLVKSKANPKNMVWIPGGVFSMGTDSKLETLCQIGGLTSDCKVHLVAVDGFWMDEHEVTNAEYAAFVKATGYKTVAEQVPTIEEFPGSSADMLFAGSVVFSPPLTATSLNNYLNWWSYEKGVNWRHPLGEKTSIQDKQNYPVVHVAWEDAMAYAKWAGKTLPTEAEWEFAARGGLKNKQFAWGNTFNPNNKSMANTFQGTFPTNDIAKDGFRGIAPVKQFPKNGYGLYDMTGNVWEWCLDWYDATYFNQLQANTVQKNPKGSKASYDPQEPGVPKKVHRGGSFLCSDQYCSRYVMGTRGKGEWRTGTNHVGFRCVKKK
jgi:formylglycine-generating enzyme required for sulfatase activity